MDNKLGLNEFDLEYYRNIICEFKSSLLDEKITFNCSEFNIDYLKSLHEYLFGDLYYDAGNISKRYNESDYKMIDRKIKEVIDLIFYESEVDFVCEQIKEIINMQIFKDGNSTTINLFFKHVINDYREVRHAIRSVADRGTETCRTPNTPLCFG